MFESFRSKFETLVFNSSADVKPTGSVMTGTSIYAWLRDHPTSIPSNPSSTVNQGTLMPSIDTHSNAAGTRPVFVRKFEMERLFEVIVMYLLNGLKPSHTQKEGEYQDDDTTSLLHYLAYIVPEADKLHVVDLDTHSGYFERIKNIRAIFDPVDYKFRVVVNKGDRSGWVDISIPLRASFTKTIKEIVPHGKYNIAECWVDIAKNFRKTLLKMLQTYTETPVDVLNTWIMRPDDIQWETAVYAAGDVQIQDLLETGDGIKEFLVSYWADNYLEFNGYKIARMFNGLVGYGEFLYDRDNNYSRTATNNFFITDASTPDNKRWIWKDLPETEGGAICDIYQRSNVLEAVIQHGKLSITDSFRLMVERRQKQATDDASCAALDVIIPIILEGTDRNEEMTRATTKKLMDQIDPMFENLFNPLTATLRDSIHHVDGKLNKDILQQLTQLFFVKCAHVSSAIQNSSFTLDSIGDNVTKTVSRMVKIFIHTAREKWLLKRHTTQLDQILLGKIQKIYTSDFWKATQADDFTLPVTTFSPGKISFMESLNSLAVDNNSSLKCMYDDPASTTYGVGYMRAARKNNYACNPFGCGLSVDILQGYYDRKVQNTDSEFITSYDVTSVMRSTQALVRGLEKFLECGQSESEYTRHRGDLNRKPVLKITRTPFAAQGCYYVLQGKFGVYGPVAGGTAGKRAVHSDDLVTFTHTLFTIVDNPGIWNLLNTGQEDSGPFTPQIANIGFVNNGTKIEDGSVHDKTSWKGISHMTFTKLRVGVMDQPNVANTANRYTNEILNNTRRITGQTVQHAFQSFMFAIYNSEEFMKSFDPAGKRATGQDRRHAHELNTTDLRQFIQHEAEKFVDRLHQCCKDSNLQVTSSTDSNYAFPALQQHSISLPTDGVVRNPGEKDTQRHMQLFYIVFGETLYSIANDLDNAAMRNSNVPQTLQVHTNQLLARRLRNQIPAFLQNITKLFFDGDLHHSLVLQIKQQAFDKTEATVVDVKPDIRTVVDVKPEIRDETEATGVDVKPDIRTDSNTWTFERVCHDLTGALLHVRHAPRGNTLQTPTWKGRSISANATKHAVVRLFVPLTRVDVAPVDMRYEHGQVYDSSVPWGDQQKGDSIDGRTDHEKDEHIARITFQLYVDVYNQLSSYYQRGYRYRSSNGITPMTTHDIFHENRMMAMRICEDQLHLIERHKYMEGEYKDSRAWELLFNMFMYQRQLFAELTLV